MIKASSDLTKLQRKLPEIRKKLMYAESEALNQTANIAAKAQRAQADKIFDRPTPFLLNGIFNPKGRLGFVGIFSRFNTLRAELIPGAPRGQFRAGGERINKTLHFQIRGGTRTPKKRALPIPTERARRNKYGNLSRTYIKTLLAKDNHVQLGLREGVQPGIYRRERSGELTMLVAWEPTAKYRRGLFPYFLIAKGVFAKNFDKQFEKAFKKEMSDIR